MVRLLIALLTIALCGILFLQYRLLKNNVELKEESFGRNALAALNEASERVEEIDVRNRLFSSASDREGPFVIRMKQHAAYRGGVPPGESSEGSRRDSMVFVSVVTSESGSLSAQLRGEILSYRIDGPRNITIRIYDQLGRFDTTILDEMKRAGLHELRLPAARLDSGVSFIQIRADSATSTIRWDRRGGSWVHLSGDEESRTAKILGRVAETVSSVSFTGLSERVRPGMLDTLLSEALEANGIQLPYQYVVRDLAGDTLVISRMDSGSTVPDGAYATLLFPAGFGGQPGELLLWFPGYTSYIVQSILPELLLNVLFVLIIGVCFRYAIRTLRKQREFAGRLSDFISNMTHEFKTPLSTIALSTEALARPDVAEDRSKVEMYGTIIADEQKRMKLQVDRILGMAALEEGDFEFREEILDLHEIVSRAAAGSSLRVKEHGGSVSTDLRAEFHTIRGDGVHVENVVSSVLDNAEKYSHETPAIVLSTRNDDGWIVLSVADRGIGIGAEHLPNIFEKYYRVPTDNLHDVKGFGLGLSYVRLVVERHGGSVRAASSPGTGTTVEMKFRVHDGR